jgi:hypothetical protein
MDVSFWGPSGWQLLHLLAAKGDKDTLLYMPDVLPCKYCRKSARQFRREDPPHGDLQRWLYNFHNKVNLKLTKQHEKDPKCPRPIPAGAFEGIQKHYEDLLNTQPTEIPGRDFLYSMAYNYETRFQKYHERFWEALVKAFPYYTISMPDLTSNLTYVESLHSMFSKIKPQKSLQSIRQQLAYYKSGCKSRTYKGKTCKKVGTGYTKSRDRNKTYRLTHSRLL